MSKSLAVARIHGVEVRLHPTFVLVFLWVLIDWRRFGFAAGPPVLLFTFGLVTLVFACVLVHEFGHVFMARQQGVHVHDVSLSAVGGMARMEQMPENNPRTEILIALAGPFANLALATAIAPIILVVGVSSGFRSWSTMPGPYFNHRWLAYSPPCSTQTSSCLSPTCSRRFLWMVDASFGRV
jgi:Zn-dependent protease